MLAVNFLLDVMSVICVAMTGAGDSPGPSITRRVRALRVLLQKAATGLACGRTARRGQLIEGVETGIAAALPMKDWMVALVAFLFFAALLAVGVVLIAVDILRAYAVDHRDTKRRLQQSITKPSVPLPPLRPRSPSHRRKACGSCTVHAFSGACAWGGGCARGHASCDARP